jgi:hypothetical protein
MLIVLASSSLKRSTGGRVGSLKSATRRAFPKFESYGMLETAAFRGWKAQDLIEWFHGIGRLVPRIAEARVSLIVGK